MKYYTEGKYFLDRGRGGEALMCFQNGLDADDPKCAYGLYAVNMMLGCTSEESENALRAAIPNLIQMANEGDADCAFIVGRCFETGSVLKQSTCHAVEFYRRSADGGCADAMYNLACLYMYANGNDLDNISEYFYSAAAAGSIHACFSLGMIYEQKGDMSQALFWYKRAAVDGSEEMKAKYADMKKVFDAAENSKKGGNKK